MPDPIRPLFAALCLLVAAAPAAAQELAAECEYAPDGPSQIVVGTTECLRMDSEMMGGKMPFTYYVPPACDPALGRACPVFIALHGNGGSYAQMLGPRGQNSNAFIHALGSGPSVDPRTVAEPWTFASPTTWVPKPAMDVVLVAPHGSLLADGHNRFPGDDEGSAWQDWHPDYFEGGDKQTYDGPPPRNASYIVRELIPYLEEHFPVITEGRRGRGLFGISHGSIGTGHIGLRWPDEFSSLLMISGVGLAWPPACAVDPGGNEVAVPLDGPPPFFEDFVLDHPSLFPQIPLLVGGSALVLDLGFGSSGDWATVDYAYTRQHHPPDLMGNARAFRDGEPVLRLHFIANDSIPRRVEDGAGAVVASALEHLVATESGPLADQECNLRDIPHTFEFNPGVHSGPYWAPYYRVWLEEMYAEVEHRDGSSLGNPDPDVFDYRTMFRDFEVWDWEFSAERNTDEFLNLTDVSCDSLTLRGTGLVHVTVPLHCGTGLGGSRQLTVDLGPSPPSNENAALGLCESYGNTETVLLQDLDGDGLTGADDNCPQVANPDQLDSGGVDTTVPDGIGDACQCGDVTGNGIVNGQDGNAIRRHGLGAEPNPIFRVPGNCDVTGNGACNGQDANAVRAAALGAESPLFGQSCHNALGIPVPAGL